MTQPESYEGELEWLTNLAMEQVERITKLETRIDKKHEELVEIKRESNKQREHEMMFTNKMSEISVVLEQATKNIDNTQREISKLKEDVDTIHEDITATQTKESVVKWLIGAIGTFIGLIISVWLGLR